MITGFLACQNNWTININCMMSSSYFVLTFLKYLCPLEQNIKGNNQPIGAQNKYMDALKKDIVDCKQR